MYEADGINWILEQAGRVPLLSKDEELICARNVQAWLPIRGIKDPTPAQKRIIRAGQRAYDRFYRGNLRLVIHIAKRYTKRATTLDFLDLIQEGALGLGRAIELFDHSRGYKFSTYSYWWIRQSITRAIAVQDRTIRLPVQAFDQLSKARNWVPEFEREHGRRPTTAEIAKHCGCSEQAMKNYLLHDNWIVSLDAHIKGERKNESTLLELIAGEASDPLESAEVDLALNRMAEQFEQLPEKQQQVLTMRFGLDGEEPKSLVAVGKHFGNTRENIRTTELRALRSLAHRIKVTEAA